MKGFDRLKLFDGYWPTNKGGWIPGGTVFFRDKNLFDEFSEKSWITLLIYGVRGVMPSTKEVEMVEHLANISSSYPDPRLWNNRISALCGTVRSTGVLAISSATALSEASIFGRRADIRCAFFLILVKEVIERGEIGLDDFLKNYLQEKRVIPGYGRPIMAKDERIEPLLKETARLGVMNEDFLSLIESVTESLSRQRYRMKPNISIHVAAVFLGMGFTPYEFYMVSSIAFTAGIMPCYLDALEKSEGVLFPLKSRQVEYAGTKLRRYDNEKK